jgi:hypothetical protein
MRAFEIHSPKHPAAKPAPPKRRRRRRHWLLAILFLLLLGLGWWAFRPDPQVARAKALQQELFASRSSGPPSGDRKAKVQEFRQAVGKLTDGQKRELFEPMRQKAKQDFARYSTLNRQEKGLYLDQAIDRSEKMRQERDQRAKAGGVATGFGPPGGGGKGPQTPEQIEDRKKRMLDRTTPEERAQRDQFRHDLEERRKQRGLPPGNGGFRG